MTDSERNRLSARAARYARVGANVGGVAARMAGARLFGFDLDRGKNAAELAAALGGLKGPIMKVAQLMATIPDVLPPEYADELAKLQSQAPPMGWAFVKRRMMAELGADWQAKFTSFEHQPAAAASLGQVHRAVALDGAPLACKLQYPDMQSAVEADLEPARMAVRHPSPHGSRRSTPPRSPRRSARACARSSTTAAKPSTPRSIGRCSADESDPRPGSLAGAFDRTAADARLARRQAAADAQGRRSRDPQPHRDRDVHGLVVSVQPLRRHPRRSASRQLHGVRRWREGGTPRPEGINLLDYGCIRIFPPRFVGGVVDLYNGLLRGDEARVVHAYETWGFQGLRRELIDMLNIWAQLHLRAAARRPRAHASPTA